MTMTAADHLARADVLIRGAEGNDDPVQDWLVNQETNFALVHVLIAIAMELGVPVQAGPEPPAAAATSQPGQLPGQLPLVGD